MSRPGHTCHENVPCCQQENHKTVVIGKLTGTCDRGLEKGISVLSPAQTTQTQTALWAQDSPFMKDAEPGVHGACEVKTPTYM